MDGPPTLAFLRSRIAVVAIAVALSVVAASALYLYLTRPQPPTGQPPASTMPSQSSIPTASPSVGAPGSPTVTDAAAVEVLTVVATSPSSGDTGAAPRTAIEMSFNLPVDAAAAQSYFSVLPEVPGTFSPGRGPKDIVFTPSGTFGLGSSVNVVIRKGYASRNGYALEEDYAFSFGTALAQAQVVFEVGSQIARLHNVQSGHSATVTLQFGDAVPADTMLQTYRATSGDLLTALVHKADGTYLDRPIQTARMELLDRARARNGRTYTITQPDGIYLLLAANRQAQYGAMWLDVSRFGVILRQDDQKVVGAGIDLESGSTTPTFDITFYNLNRSVQPVLSGSFTGSGEFAATDPAHVDVAVATSAGEDVVIPLGISQTNADIKSRGDLSNEPQIFLTTDRAGYQQRDVVRFSGVVRLNNDQAYTVPAGMTVAVWSGYGADKPVSKHVAVAPDGTFQGTFRMPASAFNDDGTDSQLPLFAGTPVQEDEGISPFVTLVGALGDHDPKASITVGFDKTTYVARDEIVASLSAVDRQGNPLGGKRLHLRIYATGRAWQPSELDSFAVPSSWGLPISGARISLDSQGKATYTFSANVADKEADQEVTLVAEYGSGETAAIVSRTAIVYQADEEIYLLPSRTIYQPGETVIAPFVVETTAGDRAGAVPITYEFGHTEYKGSRMKTTVVATGTLTTGPDGVGVVRAAYSGPGGEVVLRVKGRDAAGNTFVDTRSLTITEDLVPYASIGATDSLVQLSAIPDRISYTVGETARITVASPAAMSAFVSLERGRIHRSEWVSLQRGENRLRYKVTADLAPGFTLTLSYFRDGSYFSEGLPISVNNANRMLTLAVTSDRATYSPGQVAHLTVAVTDSSGAPIAATLLVDAYDANISAHRLVDQPSIAGTFFTPTARATNSSSSLVGIGNWGGRCGMSGNANESAPTNPGGLVVWLPHLVTNAQGQATIDVPIERGAVRLVVYAHTSATLVGQAQLELSAP
jgi:Alpha-2-macroglobulin bait region domain/Bacterial Ig-like domain